MSLPASTTVDAGEPLKHTFTYGDAASPQRDFIVEVTTPEATRHQRQWNALGWLLESCEPASTRYCTRYRYDEAGQVVEIDRPEGPEGEQRLLTTMTYGPLGEVLSVATQVSAASTLTETRAYDKNRNLLTVDAPGVTPVHFVYDERNRLLKETQAPSTSIEAVTIHRYDASNRITEVVDPRGHTSRVYYDGHGRPRQTVDAIGNYQLTRYDDESNPVLIQSCSADGQLISSQSAVYDSKSRPISQSERLFRRELDLGELTTTMAYNVAGQVTQVTDPRGHKTKTFYDAAQRPISTVIEDASGAVIYRETVELDKNGRIVLLERIPQVVAGGNPTKFKTDFTYDARGLLIKIVDDLENATEHTYDAQGRVASTTDPSGFRTSYAYDGLGRKTLQTRPLDLELKWIYTDAADHRQVIYRDAKEQSTTYLYDGLGRLTSTTYPDATSETTTFDPLGNPTTVVQPDGTSTAHVYDPTNRLLSRTITPAAGVLPPTTENYTYVDGARQMTASRGTVTSAFTYDSLGRLIEDETEGYSVTYAYDPSGNRSHIGYPSVHQVVQTFNSRNQLEALSGPTSATFSWHGDLPSGYTAGPSAQTRIYDPAGRLKTLETKVGTAQRFREDLTV
ncbi:MAG: hypothetical protein AAFY88_14775, partial [Acidobacteriota bacterium]